MEPTKSESRFLQCFDGVISTCRNVFSMTFLRVKKLKIAIAGALFKIIQKPVRHLTRKMSRH